MRRFVGTTLCFLLALSLGGCRAKKELDRAAIDKDLKDRGTIDLMKETEKDKYTPPVDGRLTDAQIQMYLKVREHEKEIAKVAREQLQQHADASKKAGDKSITGMMEGFKSLSSVGDILTADIRAAKDLGYNTKEYMWIKEQVLKASGLQMSRKLQQAGQAIADSSYQQIKKQYDEAKDEQSKKALGDMLASMEKSRQDMKAEQEKTEPATEYNLALLSKYENALNAISTEMGKWEDKEGQAKQGMEQFQTNVDKAVQDAKKQQGAPQ
jgi:hypothetical protein